MHLLQRHIPLTTTIFLLDHLRVMLRAGIPIGQALQSIGENAEQPRLRQVIDALRSAVERGEPFAACLRQQRTFLPTVAVELIGAGEASGTLEDALQEAAAYLRKEHELRSRVQSALLYPAIVVGAMVVVGVGVIVFILPRLLSLFQGVTVPLPLPTRVLLALSSVIERYGVVIGVALIAAIAAVIAAARSAVGRPTWHRILLRMGRIGRILRELNVARMTRTLAGLLRTDIPIVRALELTAMTLGNVHYRRALSDAAADVARGVTIAAALRERRDLFPPTVVQMVAIGERTGALDRLLAELADFYESNVDQTLRNLTTIIEPILMLIMGVAVAFLAVAVLMPMYTVAQAI